MGEHIIFKSMLYSGIYDVASFMKEKMQLSNNEGMSKLWCYHKTDNYIPTKIFLGRIEFVYFQF